MARPSEALKLGDRIMWPGDSGNELGTVRWMGTLPDDATRDVTVGVEFDNQVGTGTGTYKDQRLFQTKHNHASLIPLMGLIKVEPQDEAPPPYLDQAHCITNSSAPPAEPSAQFGQSEKLPQEPPPPYAAINSVAVNSAYVPSPPSVTAQPQNGRYQQQQQAHTASQNQYAPTQSGCCGDGCDDGCNLCVVLCCCALCQ